MRIGYFADGPWAHYALEKILTIDCVEVSFIVGRFSNGGDDWLLSKAQDLGIPYLIFKNINDKNVVDNLKLFQCDLFISMSFDQIIKKQLIELPPRGFINCHAGALPFYRGRNILNWALINGETSYGITVHYIDEGVDTGDIIRQVFYNISVDDDYKSLLSKSYTRCADVLSLALNDIIDNKVDPTRQSSIDTVGSYFKRRKQGDEYCSFNWPAIKVHNFIRGITSPAPCARVFIDDNEIALVKSNLIDTSNISMLPEPGTIVAGECDGIIVSCNDAFIKIMMIADTNGLAIKNIRIPDIPIGEKFETISSFGKLINC